MDFAMNSAQAQAGAEILERILAAPSGLITLESEDLHELFGQFKALARHTGQAIYVWQPDTGLISLRDAQARVPNCQRLGNALRYMQQSMHFGVYLLVGLELPLSAADASLLRQFARAPKGHVRQVVLVDVHPAVAEDLGSLAIPSGGRVSRRVRLRDGRWLV